jgi:hypothetical protein
MKLRLFRSHESSLRTVPLNKNVAIVGGQNYNLYNPERGANIVYYIPSHGGDGEDVISIFSNRIGDSF